MKSSIPILLSLATATLMTSSPAFAQAAEAPKGWETIANAGFTMTRGNSHSSLFTAGIDTAKKWEQQEMSLGAKGGYGSSDGSRSTDFVNAYAQYNKLISERAYFGLRVDGEHSSLSDLAYRIRISPLLGYYMVKNERTSLAFEAGPSAVIERYQGPGAETDIYLAARFAERFEHKISDTTKIWQYAEYVPYVEDWMDKYLINAEVGISTAITDQWGLRLVLQWQHDSEPVAGRDSNDVRLIAGTEYKF
jgi:putative salt-induced outer membrane protein YdiY